MHPTAGLNRTGDLPGRRRKQDGLEKLTILALDAIEPF